MKVTVRISIDLEPDEAFQTVNHRGRALVANKIRTTEQPDQLFVSGIWLTSKGVPSRAVKDANAYALIGVLELPRKIRQALKERGILTAGQNTEVSREVKI
jgi:hypothetical protein